MLRDRVFDYRVVRGILTEYRTCALQLVNTMVESTACGTTDP